MRWLNISIASSFLLAGVAVADEQQPLSERQKVVHVLNRLGYGPRPGDVERVEKMGLEAYVRQQFHPEEIDDTPTEVLLGDYDTLTMGSDKLIKEFYGEVRQFIERQKAGGGNAEEMKVRYGIEVAKGATTQPAAKPEANAPARGRPGAMAIADRDSFRVVGELQEAKILRATLSERQLQEVLVDFWGNHFNIDVKKNLCRVLKAADDREVIRPHVLGKFRDLLEASAKSPAMLVYLDNSQNSVTIDKPGALEMAAREMFVKKMIGQGQSARALLGDGKQGPNENYGREILELHTLGVDGGYTQKDVQEVARCFTGWTLNPITGKFNYTPRRHDNGEKLVLGHVIPAGGGMKDGEMVIDILASHPSTAKFISRKLCQRFVCDEPPTPLVDRVAKVFADSQGDLRKVVEAIVTSPEFFSKEAYRAKVKSPFEFAVSAVRATGGKFVEPPQPVYKKVRCVMEGAGTAGYGAERLSAAPRKPLDWMIHEMGQPLFAYGAPTGYPEVSSKWVSSGALIERLNFALALAEQRVQDVEVTPEKLVEGVDADQPAKVLERMQEVLLQGEVSAETKKVLEKTLVPEGDKMGVTVKAGKVMALLLGSPEFQRR